MALDEQRPGLGKLGIALAIFVGWLAITMGFDIVQAGGEMSLDALVSQRVVIGLVVAPAFLMRHVNRDFADLSEVASDQRRPSQAKR